MHGHHRPAAQICWCKLYSCQPTQQTPAACRTHAYHLARAGQRCTTGHGKNTYGTGCFLLVNTGMERVHSKAGLLSTIAFQLGPEAETDYALEGSIGIAGMAISWLRDQMGLIKDAEESATLAAQVEDTGAFRKYSDSTFVSAQDICMAARHSAL
jgi:glycerol kinase